jgi:predicted NodU family carbamoyl transferase
MINMVKQHIKNFGQRYPHSIGLFYSAITKRLGLHPLDEEYITMGMAAYGRSAWEDHLKHALIRQRVGCDI